MLRTHSSLPATNTTSLQDLSIRGFERIAVIPWYPSRRAINGIFAEVRPDAPRPMKVIPGLTHLALPRHPAVYAQIRAWCEGAST